MTKNEIEEIFNKVKNNYSWELYFFTIDKRKSGSPYKITKINFRRADNILDLGEKVVETVKKYQLEKIEEIQKYCGENPKITCDILSLEDDIINEYWNYFNTALNEAVVDSNEDIKIKGYVICARPKNSSVKKILFIKKANPVVKGNKRSSKAFKMEENEGLDSFNDKIYRFYLTVDFFVIENNLYTFNLSFQEMFKIEKTLNKIKEEAISKILEKDFIKESNRGDFLTISSQTYSGFNEEKLEEISDLTKRKKLAEILELNLSEDGTFIFENIGKIKTFIKYLNNKIIKEEGTERVLEISGSIKELKI